MLKVTQLVYVKQDLKSGHMAKDIMSCCLWWGTCLLLSKGPESLEGKDLMVLIFVPSPASAVPSTKKGCDMCRFSRLPPELPKSLEFIADLKYVYARLQATHSASCTP